MFNLVQTSLLSTPPLSILAQDGFDPDEIGRAHV